VLLKRLLKVLNALILLAFTAGLIGVYWYAWRPLPRTSGTLVAPVAARGSIARDASGMPRITASSIEDALFLQGFATAQDRMWQMDMLRRTAAGRLAEVLGQAGLQMDREARRLRLERLADEHAAALTLGERAAFAAYARGINFYLETHRDRPPVEFRLLRYDPRPWRIADSILVGLQLYRDLTSTWTGDLRAPNALAAAGPAAAQGSNAWVISGRHTATGKPILANDPHLQYSLPGIWHAVQLSAPGLNAAGVALPGVPGVIIGHNERIAWGMANLGFDVQDLYVEKLDPRTGRYVVRGKEEQARLERNAIGVRGGASVEYTQWVTRNGPVSIVNGQAIALRWTAAEPGGFRYPIIDLNRAANWNEFRAALAGFSGPAQNFVYADVDGNIGYQVAGRLPVRRGFDGTAPVDGASGDYDWLGAIPFDELPHLFNPPSGRIVTANQNPFPPDYAYTVSGNFAAPFRAQRIESILESRSGWRAADMAAIQNDVYSGFLLQFSREVVAAHKGRGADVADAIAVLRDWNGQMDQNSAAPLLATLAYQHLWTEIAERAAEAKLAIPARQTAPAVVQELLRARPRDLFEDWDEIIVRSFREAVDEGRRMQGDNVRRWSWGVYNRLHIPHPVLSRLPFVGRYYTIGPVAQSGSAFTVKQTTRVVGPSMRMALDLADWNRSQLTLLTGVSGQPLSRHLTDQWEDFYRGRGRTFPFDKAEAEDVLEFTPR